MSRPWTQCAEAGWAVLAGGGSAVDAVVAAASTAEADASVDSVGFGAHPDSNGETTLDAMVTDATTMSVGAVGALRSVRGAAAVARLVMRHTTHTLMVGSQATDLAVG